MHSGHRDDVNYGSDAVSLTAVFANEQNYYSQNRPSSGDVVLCLSASPRLRAAMSGQADIVKKASLKLKVVRSKTGAAGLQGVRSPLRCSGYCSLWSWLACSAV